MSSNQYQKKLTSYFNFKEGNQTIFSVELLKKSKELILDTNKYLDYSSYYNNLTMVHSFKLPNISDYPIRTNESIIPIKEYNKREKEVAKTIREMNIRNLKALDELVKIGKGNVDHGMSETEKAMNSKILQKVAQM